MNGRRLTGRMLRSAWTVAVLVAAACLGPAARAAPLDDYVRQDDGAYGWVILQDQRDGAGFRTLHVELTSQKWQGYVWKHRLLVVVPPAHAPASTGLLYISGSGSGVEELAAMRQVATLTGAVSAALMDIPNQPIMGLREDALIAYTFGRFAQTQDPTWPLLLPMTKGAVKAMDALQEIARQELGGEIERFVVAGASKRGWTTWLAAAVDERVAGIAPMVYNNLNLPAQLALQAITFPGGASPKIADYTAAGLPALLATPVGRLLVSIVDPYAYVDRLTLPKMLLHGSNDPYWPADALNVYLDDLPGETFIVNFANGGHDLKDLTRVTASIAAFYRHVAQGPVLPQLDWHVAEDEEGNFVLAVARTPQTVRASLWVAAGPTRDFTQASWLEVQPREEDGYWVARPMRLRGQYLGVFMDVAVDIGGGQTVTLSTPIFILDPPQ